jgi:phosphatidylglycerol:prolipoprotein diacylglycerol transferase
MHPILFKAVNSPLELRSYGAMLFIAFIVGIAHSVNSAKRRPQENISADETLDISVWMIITGIVFARLVFVLLDPHVTQYTWKTVLAVWNGGISFDGSLIGALIAMGVYCRIHKKPFMAMADRFAAPAMIGYAIGRIGCFLNGCCYGASTTMPWGVRFYDTDGPVSVWTAPSHPTQLYATLISLVWYVILTRKERKGRAYVGELTCLYLVLSAIERFTIEIWRAGVTSDYVHGTPFTTAQFFCFVLLGIGLFGMNRCRAIDKKQLDSPKWGDAAGALYREKASAGMDSLAPQTVSAS